MLNSPLPFLPRRTARTELLAHVIMITMMMSKMMTMMMKAMMIIPLQIAGGDNWAKRVKNCCAISFAGSLGGGCVSS